LFATRLSDLLTIGKLEDSRLFLLLDDSDGFFLGRGWSRFRRLSVRDLLDVWLLLLRIRILGLVVGSRLSGVPSEGSTDESDFALGVRVDRGDELEG